MQKAMIFSNIVTLCIIINPALAIANPPTPFPIKQTGQNKAERKPWTLQYRKSDQEDTWWWKDQNLIQLVADGDIAIEALGMDQANLIWEANEWGPVSHWLLLDRRGEKVFDSALTPKGELVLAAIHGVGGRTFWETREAFLVDHPDSGEALEARLITALKMAGYRYRYLVKQGYATPTKFGQAQSGKITLGPDRSGPEADRIFTESADTLERILALPDGWRLSSSCSALLGQFINLYDAGESPRMSAALRRLRDQVVTEWANTPNLEGGVDSQPTFGLSSLWVSCERVLNDGRITSLPYLTPAPGRIYPKPDLLYFVANQMRDQEALLSFLGAIHSDVPTQISNISQWKDYLWQQSSLAALFTMAYSRLGRWEQARIALQECRRWMGGRWKEDGLVREFDLEHWKSEEPSSKIQEEVISQKPPTYFLELLRKDPEPDLLPPPAPPPIRMVLWGNPAWRKEWWKLSNSEPLSSWGPDELQWAVPTKEEEAFMKRQTWEPPKWAAFQDNTKILTVGNALPDPRFLAFQLSSTGQTRLQRLNAFIRNNPDNVDARFDRFHLLRSRMPNRFLESLLAEDAAKGWIPLDFDKSAPWLSDVTVFEAQAAKLMPELESAIRRWPSSTRLWRIWISWLPFRIEPQSPYNFALHLAVPRPQGDWLASLPSEVHLAVAAELRRHIQYDKMRAWFQCAWDSEAIKKDDRAGTRRVIFTCLTESLSALRQKPAIQRLAEEYKQLLK